jgi:hypothetical protein
MPSGPTLRGLHRVRPACLQQTRAISSPRELTEVTSSAPAADGKQNGSLFDFNTDIAVEDLNASLLSYFVLATETRGAAPLRPVFTPSVSTRETGLLQKGALFRSRR